MPDVITPVTSSSSSSSAGGSIGAGRGKLEFKSLGSMRLNILFPPRHFTFLKSTLLSTIYDVMFYHVKRSNRNIYIKAK